MLTILQGENELARQETLDAIIKKSHLTLDLRALNTEYHQGTPTVGELRQACSTLPFLGDRRVVIYQDALADVKGDLGEALVTYLPDMPPTTHLIFVESRNLPSRHKVVTWAKKNEGKVLSFDFPKSRELSSWLIQWIMDRAGKYGGKVESRAAAALAQNFGPRLRLLDQEIQKLLLYCGKGVAVTVDDVRTMVPYVQNADVIFNMVDAIGQRNAQAAAEYLHRLLDADAHPLYILTMIVRQFRLLIQTRWMIDQRKSVPEIVERLKQPNFIVKKLYSQALRFTASQLRDAFALLQETDLILKTSKMEEMTALDLLVVKLTRL
ncbi:MAG: DNA polymerase III subunit delta [Anaerolineae bacterium]|nr:DNA polymerase III subunit delta [Anaerolineae bacterium]